MNDPRHPTPASPSLHPQQPGMPRAPQAAPVQGSGSLRPQHVVQPQGAPPARAPQQPQHSQPLRHPQQHATRPVAAPVPAASDDGDLVELSEEDDSLALVEDEAPASGAAEELAAAPKEPKKIIKWDAGALYKNETWKRTPTSTGQGPIRVKTFHGKLSEQGLEYIDHAINEWVDNHPEYEIKNVTTNIGMFDGKFRDLALIVNIWF